MLQDHEDEPTRHFAELDELEPGDTYEDVLAKASSLLPALENVSIDDNWKVLDGARKTRGFTEHVSMYVQYKRWIDIMGGVVTLSVLSFMSGGWH